ncbi:MAG: YeeE/YedE family protein [Alphaproteobacteria bacterium]|nr:YeeE/YedE family protein [Alphaproteobacteria bacterium]
MHIVNFTPLTAAIGGLLIGLASALLLLLNGRIAGVAGIMSRLLPPSPGDAAWRLWFLGGLVVGGVVWRFASGQAAAEIVFEATWPILTVGGLLVGAGTRVGNGCTSGHGVCGIGRVSPRSIAATLTFMATGALTVYVTRHWLGA